MTSRRVPILVVAAALCLAAPLSASASPTASVKSASDQPAAERADAPASSARRTIAQIRGVVMHSRVLETLSTYRRTAADNIRFLVVIDRKNERDATGRVVKAAKDLLATSDGKLWILDRHQARPLTDRDLVAHRFSLEEAKRELGSCNRRPVSIVLPKRLVSKR